MSIPVKTNGFIMMAASAAAIALLAVAATPARAAGNDEMTSVRVRFGDLNLGSGRGASKLYMRLRNAAETVCGDDDSYVDLTERRDIEQCEQKTIENAVARIDRPVLTDLYDLYYPRQPVGEPVRVASAPEATRASHAR